MRVPRAQLKVFAPLDTFAPDERERWSSYVRDRGGLTRAEHLAIEEAASARLLGGRGELGPSQALVRRHGRRVLVCPLDLTLRAATSLASFRASVPAEVADVFVPSSRLREHLDDLAASGRSAYVLDGSWVVPLHWFVAFDPRERRIRGHPEGAGTRIVYVTVLGEAIARIERALDVVDEDADSLPAAADEASTVRATGLALLAGAASLRDWLEEFPAECIVELDYGGVAGLFAADELHADDTCAQVWGVVEAIGAGDDVRAAVGYDAVRERWGRRWAMQYAN